MRLEFSTLDVFTSTPLTGNPVAIIHIPASIRSNFPSDLKQKIAKEFNLSEIVFLHEPAPASSDVQIEIFTSIAEVPFAGHPTIGTANYLLRYLQRDSTDANLREKWKGVNALIAKAGRMPVSLVDEMGVQLEVAHAVHVHENRLSSYKDETRNGFVLVDQCPVVSSVKGMSFILARLKDEAELASAPKQNLIGTENTYKSQDMLDQGWQAGILVSYFYVDLEVDEMGTRVLRTRSLGSREDPATGSAACALCSWLSLTENRQEDERPRKYKVVQGVEMGRRSEIGVQVWTKENGQAIEKLVLSGSAVKVMNGFIDIPDI